MNQLAQRIDIILEKKFSSRSRLASALGLRSQNFNKFFHAKNDTQLRIRLDQIAELWPDISRVWLETGQGDMYTASSIPDAEKLAAENQKLRTELENERELNRQLMLRLLGMTQPCERSA